MSKSRKLLVGILSLLPFISLAIYMVVFFSFFMTVLRNPEQAEAMPMMMMEHIGAIIGVVLLMLICKLGMLIYFIIHVVNNKIVDSTERIVWILVFIFAGMVGFPIYWYMRIWKEVPAT